MGQKIQILPRELAEKIAAGEVIEKPASVVKELVENSIDAQATSILIELEEGGKKRIRILDNGHGIPANDALLALERHATSKIQNLDDLWNLSTMGFRGEALPSIATVSRFTLETKTRSESEGRRVYLEGGKLLQDHVLQSTTPLQRFISGVQISVEDLFFNVPARLKFMKNKSSETSAIRDLIERLALSHPHIEFTLISEKRKVALFEKAADTAQRFSQILDVPLDHIECLESQYDSLHVQAWLDRNTRAPHSRALYATVNKRMVRDKLIQQAIMVGLKPMLMEGEYPRIFLSIHVPAADVDVNVHPAKSEVRFRQAKDVFQLIQGLLQKAAQKPRNLFYEIPAPSSDLPIPTPSKDGFLNTSKPDQTLFLEVPQPQFALHVDVESASSSFNETSVHSPTPFTHAASEPKARFIGQLHQTYLLFQDHSGLILIDQHAAHERVQYQKIKKKFLEQGLRPQPLLLPILCKCSSNQIQTVFDHFELFQNMGFEIEHFGEDSVILRSIPEMVEATHAKELFLALLEDLEMEDGMTTNDPTLHSTKIDRWIATSACHSSIRAGQTISAAQAYALLESMDQTDYALNCPHGRPASLKLSLSHLESLFKRKL